MKKNKISQQIVDYKSIILLILIVFAHPIYAQEMLTGLAGNPQLQSFSSQKITRGNDSIVYPAVKLPFIDDFSNYTGYPNPTLWANKQGFVNQSYALYPPTIGALTMDALDENGNVYAHASNNTFAADTLLSRPIRLDSAFNTTLPRPLTLSDAIYFSFYYQPGGGAYINNGHFVEWERIGDQPESDDMLVLEFGYETGDTIFLNDYHYADYIVPEIHEPGDTILNPFIEGDFIITENFIDSGTVVSFRHDSIFGPEEIWNQVWSSYGCSLDSWLKEDSLNYFKQVMIPINDEQYLRDNFQFRFRNYASLEDNNIVGFASNVDQWHIDYVMLNYNRTATDTCPDDVAFVMPPKSLLKNYQSMPWNQFRQEELADAFDNKLSNLFNDPDGANVKYTYTVKQGNNVIKNYVTNNFNAYPYYHNGFHTYAPHATPAIDFQLPTNGEDSALFVVTHIFSKSGYNDVRTPNDTAVFLQQFYNYYAYDDGVAENGYSIYSTNANPESALAMRFKLNQPDTLRAVRMWFNHVLSDDNIEPFTLMVWADDNGQPGEVIYSQDAQLPTHEKDFLKFHTYLLDEPIAVSGAFHVGFYQNHNIQLNIGFDCNNDSRANFRYRTTETWKEPILKGTPMIRPVLGKAIEPENVSVNEPTSAEPKCLVYPNPTSQVANIHIEGYDTPILLTLFDFSGRLISNSFVEGSDTSLNLSTLPNGVYFLRIVTENKIISTEKIIKK
ncbi:MAG: T9SS type A sorting domain-containing protein [Bacteroidales bacterium]|nr:T9SS type A sorting domain-containing protein [Bacteroidales bacterium]